MKQKFVERRKKKAKSSSTITGDVYGEQVDDSKQARCLSLSH